MGVRNRQTVIDRLKLSSFGDFLSRPDASYAIWMESPSTMLADLDNALEEIDERPNSLY